jgi:hypothetical protein
MKVSVLQPHFGQCDFLLQLVTVPIRRDEAAGIRQTPWQQHPTVSEFWTKIEAK